MVGPSITDEERAALGRRLRVGFVLLVAASGGLVGVAADATPPQLGGAVLAGTVVGYLLVWYLDRTARQLRERGVR